MKYFLYFAFLFLASCSPKLTQSQYCEKYCGKCTTITDTIIVQTNLTPSEFITLCDSVLQSNKLLDSAKILDYQQRVAELRKINDYTARNYYLLDSICKKKSAGIVKRDTIRYPIIKTITITKTVIDHNYENFLKDSITRTIGNYNMRLDSCSKANIKLTQLLNKPTWSKTWFAVSCFLFLVVIFSIIRLTRSQKAALNPQKL